MEEPALGHQLFIISLLHNISMVHHQDAVTALYGAEPVGDDHPGAAHFLQRFAHLGLCQVIQCAGGLVKEENVGPVDDGPGNENALLLAAGDGVAVFADHGLQPHGHLLDISGQAYRLHHLLHLGSSGVGGGEGDVLKDAP